MTFMSELPAGDTHDVISHSGRVVAVVVPIEEYTVPGGMLNIHFLPEGEVRLIISSKGAGAKNYPGPTYPVKPPDWKW